MIFWTYYTLLWNSLFILPLLIFFYIIDFQKNIIWNIIIFITIQFIIWVFLKFFFFKQRPLKIEYNNFFTKVKASAFPSMHSANTFLLFLFSTYYLSFSYCIFFFVFWLSISYSRIILKKHFYIDIFSWMLLAFFIFALFLL